jgi:D-arabinose 1-dehydrogenase-like Zn-dependent alcohol dehydrogenase
MARMRAAQVTGPNGSVEIVEREIPEPGAGQVRIRGEACGVCHSDSFTKDGTLPGIKSPRISG